MDLFIAKKLNIGDEILKIITAKNIAFDASEVPRALSEATEIRAEMSQKIDLSAVFNAQTLSVLQEKLGIYVCTILNFALYIEAPSAHCQFVWKTRFGAEFENSNFYFEVACALYNYAAISARKAALLGDECAVRAFRESLWGVENCARAAARCAGKALPAELAPNALRGCREYVAALAFDALFRVLKGKSEDFDAAQRLRFHKSAYLRAFEAAATLNAIDRSVLPNGDDALRAMKAMESEHLAEMLLARAKTAEQNHANAITKGFIGEQIAYIEAMRGYSLSGASEALRAAIGAETAKLPRLKLENDQIYRAAVPRLENLPPIAESEHVIAALEQPQFKRVLPRIALSARSAAAAEIAAAFGRLVDGANAALAAKSAAAQRARAEAFARCRLDALADTELELRLEALRAAVGEGFAQKFAELSAELTVSDRETLLLANALQSESADASSELCKNGFLSNFDRHGAALTALRRRVAALGADLSDLAPFLKSLVAGDASRRATELRARVSAVAAARELSEKLETLNRLFDEHFEATRRALSAEFDTFAAPALVQSILLLNDEYANAYARAVAAVQMKSDEFEAKGARLALVVDRICAQSDALGDCVDALSAIQKLSLDAARAKRIGETLSNCAETNAILKENIENFKKYLEKYFAAKSAQKSENDVFRKIGAYFDRFIEEKFSGNSFVQK